MAMDVVAQPKSSLTPASYQSMSGMGARNRMVSNYRYASLGYPVYYLMYIEEILQKKGLHTRVGTKHMPKKPLHLLL
jgi:hypothetical protein